jgi:3-methyladenine DNA glycosylase AlkC
VGRPCTHRDVRNQRACGLPEQRTHEGWLIDLLKAPRCPPAMPDSDSPAPAALKEMFNSARYHALAEALHDVFPRVDRPRFLKHALDGLEERSLLQRLRRTSEAMHLVLPDSYFRALDILKQLAPRIGHNFVGIFLSDYVALYGRAPEFRTESLEALRYFTEFGSAEFAIREFLRNDLHGTLRVMRKWTADKNEHVRRLSSEGCRPRLPWSFRIKEIDRDPSLTSPILQNLIRDESLYVRKSVANHLNDFSKAHPEWLVTWLSEQDLAHPHAAWIARRALRTLIKQGHRGALRLMGSDGAPDLGGLKFELSPKRVVLGDRVRMVLQFTTGGKDAQKLVVDYAIHFVKSSGATSPKVFKWRELHLPAGTRVDLAKEQRLQNFTTRQHYSGVHRVDVLINGTVAASAAFHLKC